MKRQPLGVVLAVLAACGGATRAGSNQGSAETRALAEDALIQAVGKRDPAAIERLLRAPVELGGLWFDDEACREQFSQPARVEAAALPALAKCLAFLPLQRSQRRATLYNASIFRYEPGIELEVQFRMVGSPTVKRIGYAGRGGAPTVTYRVLEAQRGGGDPIATLAPAQAQRLAAERATLGGDYAYAWVEVCVDETGQVRDVYPREATSPATHEAFAAVVKTWTFKPIVLGTRPTPACAQVRLIHPPDATVGPEILSVPYDPDHAIRIPIESLRRTSGTDLIPPDDDDKLQLENAGGGTLVGVYQLCVDAAGRTTKISVLERTGYPAYDRKLEAAVSGWAYEPFVVAGRAIEVCGAVVFVYQQG